MFDAHYSAKSTTLAFDATPGLASGMVVGTLVATSVGWRPIEGVLPGDMVLTFDGGLQRVISVQRGHLWSGQACPRHMWPLIVPDGAIGNEGETILLPEQSVMIESDCAEDLLGDPFALIPAAALDGLAGVERMPPPHDLDVVILHFADDQIVFASKGALFFCPAAQTKVDLTRSPEADQGRYDLVPLEHAVGLIRSMTAQMSDYAAF